MKLKVKLGWVIENPLNTDIPGTDESEPLPLVEIRSDTITQLIEEGAFGKTPVVTFRVEDEYVLATVEIDDEVDPNEFFLRFLYKAKVFGLE
ncbi:MAG: hypothetical protein V1664_02960 [Candidatus Uhrbacteria bacterium]